MSSSEPLSVGAPAAAHPAAAPEALERIAAQAAVIDTIPERPLAEQAEAYQQVHTALQGILAEIERS